MNELDKNIYSDEIDVKDIINALFAFKKTIISFTSLAAICSVIYALYLPNIYTSSALLSVANEKNQLTKETALLKAAESASKYVETEIK